MRTLVASKDLCTEKVEERQAKSLAKVTDGQAIGSLMQTKVVAKADDITEKDSGNAGLTAPRITSHGIAHTKARARAIKEAKVAKMTKAMETRVEHDGEKMLML